MFTLQTDHKPLMTILGPRSAIPTLAAARMQQWALILSAYHYKIEYRRSSENANADAMSRLPVDVPESEPDNEEFLCSFVEELPIRARDIGEATRVDKMSSQVLKYTQEGWPGHLTESLSELKPYLNIYLWNKDAYYWDIKLLFL